MNLKITILITALFIMPNYSFSADDTCISLASKFFSSEETAPPKFSEIFEKEIESVEQNSELSKYAKEISIEVGKEIICDQTTGQIEDTITGALDSLKINCEKGGIQLLTKLATKACASIETN